MLIIQNEIDCLNIILTLIIHFFHFNLDNKHCLQKQNLIQIKKGYNFECK